MCCICIIKAGFMKPGIPGIPGIPCIPCGTWLMSMGKGKPGMPG